VATTTSGSARRLEGDRDRSGLDSGSTPPHPRCSRRKARGDFGTLTGKFGRKVGSQSSITADKLFSQQLPLHEEHGVLYETPSECVGKASRR
jgi:hypothetical protein